MKITCKAEDYPAGYQLQLVCDIGDGCVEIACEAVSRADYNDDGTCDLTISDVFIETMVRMYLNIKFDNMSDEDWDYFLSNTSVEWERVDPSEPPDDNLEAGVDNEQ